MTGIPAGMTRAELEPVVAPFGRSRTLPGAAYTDPETLDWELENVFERTWVCVGRFDELLGPGQIRAIDIVGEKVLLARDTESRLTSFYNVCRHRGHELAPVGDAIDARLIRCPYHSWSYRYDGSLRAAPTFTQTPGFDMSEWPLVPVRTVVYGGWVWIDLSGEAPAIEDHFGNLGEIVAPYEPERLRTVATHEYVVEANWKVVVENYNECYHCTSIHPELCEVTPVDSGRDHQPTGMWLGGTMELKDHAVTMSLDGRSKGVNFRNLPEGDDRIVWYLTVTPNLLLSLHPDYVMTHRITPIGVDRTHVECSWLWPPEALELADFDPSYAVDFWDITNRQDWTACEAVQRGVSNRGYRQGPLSSWEGTVYQFLAWTANLYLGNGFVVPVAPERNRVGSDPGS
ncbi:MAG TPA: aromatic ring-hydroxylating dioxygenase subunit alpha [Acidimicrobiia bacterium]